MNDEIGVLCLCALIAFMFFCIGSCTGDSSLKKEAVANGAGYYSVNPTSGVTKFEWRKCE